MGTLRWAKGEFEVEIDRQTLERKGASFFSELQSITGVVTPGPRVPSVMGHYVTYVDGVPQPAPTDEAAAG